MCCNAAPLSCREHLLQSFQNMSALQRPQRILTTPTTNGKTAKKSYRKTVKSHFILLAADRKAQLLTTAQQQPCDTENPVGCKYLIPHHASDVLVPTLLQPKV